MITREELIEKIPVGMKVQIEQNKFTGFFDEGILTATIVDKPNFTIEWTKENGAKIIEVLGNPYRYDIDSKYILTFHNDRVDGWIVTERKRIISGGPQ